MTGDGGHDATPYQALPGDDAGGPPGRVHAGSRASSSSSNAPRPGPGSLAWYQRATWKALRQYKQTLAFGVSSMLLWLTFVAMVLVFRNTSTRQQRKGLIIVLSITALLALASYGITLVYMLVIHIRMNKWTAMARRGERKAVNSVVLPIYRGILKGAFFYVVVDFVSVGMLYFNVLVTTGLVPSFNDDNRRRLGFNYEQNFGFLCPVMYYGIAGRWVMMVWSLVQTILVWFRLVLFVNVAFIYLEKSLSRRYMLIATAKSAAVVTLGYPFLSIFVDNQCYIILVNLYQYSNLAATLDILTLWIGAFVLEGATVIFGIILFSLVRRPGRIWIIWLTCFMQAYLLSFALLGQVITPGSSEADGSGHEDYFIAGPVAFVIWMFVQPFWPGALLKTLRLDTAFWRGAGKGSAVLVQGRDPSELSLLQESIAQVTDELQEALQASNSQLIDFSMLRVHECIASGATSKVYRGSLLGRNVAVKVFTPPEILKEDVAAFAKEAALANVVGAGCDHVVRFYGTCVAPPDLSLVFEYCEHGGLDTLLERGLHGMPWGEVGWDVKVRLMVDVCRAVEHLHSFRPPVIHRDIKSLNFLVSAGLRCKLSDFGESRRVPDGLLRSSERTRSVRFNRTLRRWRRGGGGGSGESEAESSHMMRTMTRGVGSLLWMAPEVLESTRYSTKADVYSLAMTLYEILTGALPFEGVPAFDVSPAVIRGERPRLPDPQSPECPYDPQLLPLLQAAWDPQPERRPTAAAMAWQLEAMMRRATQGAADEAQGAGGSGSDLEDALRDMVWVDVASGSDLTSTL